MFRQVGQKIPRRNTRFPLSTFPFPAVNFSYPSSISRWWIGRHVAADCIHCVETRSPAYQYTLITGSRACPCVYGSSSVHICLAGDTDPPPGSGISSRFNWTSRIAPLPRGIGKPRGLCARVPYFGYTPCARIRVTRLFPLFPRVCVHRRIHTPGVPYLQVYYSSGSRAARTIARHALHFFISGSRRLGTRTPSLATAISPAIINFDGSLNYHVRRLLRTCVASRTCTHVYLCVHASYYNIATAARSALALRTEPVLQRYYMCRGHRDVGLSAYRYTALVTHRWTKYFMSPLRKNAYWPLLFATLW